MKQAFSSRTLAALLLGGLLLGSCGGNSNTSTSTPTSTLGTDSAATKVGGMPTDSASNTTGGVMPAPKDGSGASGTTNGTGAN